MKFLKKNWRPIVCIIMCIYTIKTLWLTSLDCYYDILETYGRLFKSELLINYQGGFVRRGLLGEIIYCLTNITGLHPDIIITTICIVAFVFTIYLFFKLLYNNNLKWWLLPLSIFLGFFNIIHKDSLILLGVLGILYCLKSICKDWIKVITINVISIFLILTHEAFFFVCIPLLFFVIVRSNIIAWKKPMRILSTVPIFLAFISVSLYHGDAQTVEKILDSWEPWYGEMTIDKMPLNSAPGYDIPGPSLGAISWEASTAMKMHAEINFKNKSLGIPGFIIRPLWIIIVFYFVVNYISSFKIVEKKEKKEHMFAPIVLFQFISLLPMFTVLSCDTCRVSCYWIASSLAFFFLIPQKQLEQSSPEWYTRFVTRMIEKMNKTIRPSLILMIGLLLFLGAPKNGSDILNAFYNSPIMGLHWLLLFPYHWIVSLL